ncbi:hypothetical protein EXIGLDRAFT_726344 [Exidia glandulosa HHB12029]|uniref:Uncharacterized protein n=1 Tax=Exidia glandulosa HHB12029 TaxID=1314781 RepID=A0A165DS05_EXIGL|nr:hypothetical protein EXIGLDRAFT_726344 [Exidia glandulosa HHB12029]
MPPPFPPPGDFFFVTAEHDEQQSASTSRGAFSTSRLASARERCRSPLHAGRLVSRRRRTYCPATASTWHDGGERAARALSTCTLRMTTTTNLERP